MLNSKEEILKRIEVFVGERDKPRIIKRFIVNSSGKIGERYQLPTVDGDCYDLFYNSSLNHSVKDIQRMFKENFKIVHGSYISAVNGRRTALDWDNVYIGEPVENFIDTYKKCDLLSEYYRKHEYFTPCLKGNLVAMRRLLNLIDLCSNITHGESTVATNGIEFRVYFRDFKKLLWFLMAYLSDCGYERFISKATIGDKFSDGSVYVGVDNEDVDEDFLRTFGYESSYMPRMVSDVKGKFNGDIICYDKVVCKFMLKDHFVLRIPLVG